MATQVAAVLQLFLSFLLFVVQKSKEIRLAQQHSAYTYLTVEFVCFLCMFFIVIIVISVFPNWRANCAPESEAVSRYCHSMADTAQPW